MVEGNFIDFVIEHRKALKLKRDMEKMRSSPKAINKAMQEKHPVYYAIQNHPIMKGVTSTTDVLNKILELNKVNTELRTRHKEVLFNDLPWLERRALTYDLDYGKGKGTKGIPSQKNQLQMSIIKTKYKNHLGKLVTKTIPMMRNSDDTNDFRRDLKFQWEMKNDDYPKLSHVMLDIIVYFPSKRNSDLDGKLTAILDALVVTGIIADDHFMTVGWKCKAKFRKNKAGFDMMMYKLTEEDFNKEIGLE